MRISTLLLLASAVVLTGCRHPAELTSVPASPFNQNEPPGMPFYMPKPLLVVSKNVRHIGEAKVGLTEPAPIPNAFDDQAGYADVKANVTSPGQAGGASLQAVNAGGISRATGEPFDEAVPGLPEGWRGAMIPEGRVQDGHSLNPDSFYTYQVIFVPDLSQKYGLNIKGNPGEVRAAMNLVNGWMYTGMGPYYLKDSSKAQNIMAVGVASLFVGRGASDVLDSVTGLAKVAGGAGRKERAAVDSDEFVDRVAHLAKVIQSQTLTPQEMLNYAEVTIYEPTLAPDGSMQWCLLASHNFSRQYFSPDMDESHSKLLHGLLDQLRPAAATPNPKQPGAAVESGDPTLESIPGGAPSGNTAERSDPDGSSMESNELPPPASGTTPAPVVRPGPPIEEPHDPSSAPTLNRATDSLRG